jgi:hypothetical protein
MMTNFRTLFPWAASPPLVSWSPSRNAHRSSGPRSRNLLLLAATASVFGQLSSAQAYDVFFNAPNVLGGIRNVPITLPSTGLTSQYDVILKTGTLEEIYGTPPVTDIDNSIDAQALMEKSADSINAYIVATSNGSLSFGEAGVNAYSIPYGNPFVDTTGTSVVNVSLSESKCRDGFYWNGFYCVPLPNNASPPIPYRLIIPILTQMPTQQSIVWADLQPVPGPLPLAGGLVAWSWGRHLRRRIAMGTSPASPRDS